MFNCRDLFVEGRSAMSSTVTTKFSAMLTTIGVAMKFVLLIGFAGACQLAHIVRLAHLGDQYYLLVSRYHWPQLATFAIMQSLPTLVLTGIVPMVVWVVFGGRRTTFNLAVLGWALLYLAAVAFSELAFMSQLSIRGAWPP
jgi:hypothetical protein